jgi:hypothetical protein
MADCTVEIRDANGDVAGNLTIKNGKSVASGHNSTLHCNNGNVTVTPTNPPPKALDDDTPEPGPVVVKDPTLVHGPEGLRLAVEGDQEGERERPGGGERPGGFLGRITR